MDYDATPDAHLISNLLIFLLKFMDFLSKRTDCKEDWINPLEN
jgi:hypothetical protein